MKFELWAPKEGTNMIRILPNYPRTEGDFFLENRIQGWVLMNIIPAVDFTMPRILVWKTDVNVLYHILNAMVDPTIGDVTNLDRGRMVNVFFRQGKVNPNLSFQAHKTGLGVGIGIMNNLPNLIEVDRILSYGYDVKHNKYRRIELCDE
jgi:hypothetical protein